LSQSFKEIVISKGTIWPEGIFSRMTSFEIESLMNIFIGMLPMSGPYLAVLLVNVLLMSFGLYFG